MSASMGEGASLVSSGVALRTPSQRTPSARVRSPRTALTSSKYTGCAGCLGRTAPIRAGAWSMRSNPSVMSHQQMCHRAMRCHRAVRPACHVPDSGSAVGRAGASKEPLDLRVARRCTVRAMRIAELARRAGVAPSAVRWYEQAGVLPAPARRGQRLPRLRRRRPGAPAPRGRLRRLGLGPEDAGRLARLCLERGAVDLDLAPLIAEQRAAIARQRDDLDRLEAELTDLELTIEAARGPRHPQGDDHDRPAHPRALRVHRQLRPQPDRRGAAGALRRRRLRGATRRAPSRRA